MTNLILNKGPIDNLIQLNNTINDKYTNDVNRFINYLKLNKKDLIFDTLKEYQDFLKSSGYKANTINKYMFAVKNRINKLLKTETNLVKLFYAKEKLNEIRKIKINSAAIDIDKIPTKVEIKKLINFASYRLALMIRFFVMTGVRCNELTNIKLNDIELNKKYYNISILGKGYKLRNIKIDKELINKIIKEFNGDKYLFETSGKKKYYNSYISNQIEKLSLRVLNRRISAHTCRHYFATEMIKQTNNTKGVSKYLGHSSSAVTLDMYVHTELKYEDLKLARI